MKRPALVMVTAIATAVLVGYHIAGNTAVAQKPASAELKWEYKLLDLNDFGPEAVQAELNKMGADGWDLLGGSPYGEQWSRYVMFLKRPLK